MGIPGLRVTTVLIVVAVLAGCTSSSVPSPAAMSPSPAASAMEPSTMPGERSPSCSPPDQSAIRLAGTMRLADAQLPRPAGWGSVETADPGPGNVVTHPGRTESDAGIVLVGWAEPADTLVPTVVVDGFRPFWPVAISVATASNLSGSAGLLERTGRALAGWRLLRTTGGLIYDVIVAVPISCASHLPEYAPALFAKVAL